MDVSNTTAQVVHSRQNAESDSFMSIFLESWLPFFILIAVYLFFMRQMKKAGKFQNPMSSQLEEMNATLKEISQKLDKR